MRKQVAIIGHFGGNEEFLDGQTVKTKILFDELSKNTDWKIQKIDTYWKNKRPFTLLLKTLLTLVVRKDIIVLLSGNGMKFYFPILSFFAKFWKVRVFHDVIGGNLDKYVAEQPRFRQYLNSFAINWVETEMLKKQLVKRGVLNCEVIPNFKRLPILNERDIPNNFDKPIRFCTFSRVMKEKGIEAAIEAVEQINKKNGRIVCLLDIYGPIDVCYKERFESVMQKVSDSVKYCGSVPYDQSVDVLKKYHALLFPTYWRGEGFPGTVVDAFSAGLPVVASDWNSNSELITNDVNGLLYPSKQCSCLEEAIRRLIGWTSNSYLIKRRNCLKSALNFLPDVYIQRIVSYMQR
ncbi:MAG: glycosyltransferase family 4 protein [Fibrobacter sp.]|nr:glycosyltransferase family 4 protein [Fibrobacter sp.]